MSIPADVWPAETLGTLTADTRPICYGVLKPGPHTPDGVPLVRIRDLANGTVHRDGLHFISSSLDREFARSRLRGGEVLLSIQGTIGRTAVVPADLAGANISRTVAVIEPGERLSKQFLTHYFEYLAARDAYVTTGSTRRSLNISTIRAMRVPVPPLDEQQRIVAAIEEQFSRLQAPHESLKSAVTRLRTLETAGLILPREQWPEVPFGEVTKNYDGRRVPVKKSDRERRPGPYPYYGAQGIIDTIDDYLFDGDFLLVAEDGANLLSRVKPLAFRASRKFWVNNHAHVVTPRTGVTIEYLEIAVNSLDIQRSVSGSAQPKLTQANLNRLLIPLPAVEVQAELVSRWSALRTGVQHLEAELSSTKTRLSHLRASILRAAFSGRLVPEVLESDLSEKVDA